MNQKPLVIRDLVAKIPVIQGGMGVGVSLYNLAGAVAKCGGIGILSTAQIGYQEPGFDENPIETNLKAMENYIKKAKEIAEGGIIGVNIMVATKNYEAYVRTAAHAGADLIISGAGLPVSLPSMIEGFKTKIAPIVSSVKSAAVIMKLWDRKYKCCPDLVVIEGPKAGGHLGFSYEELAHITKEEYELEIKNIIQEVKPYREKYGYDIPIVVAGGIYDGADMAQALSLGADGVQVGTRFVTTYECDASNAYKEAYLKAEKKDIEIVKSPVGMPGRAIHNAFIERTLQENPGVKKCHQCLERCNHKDIPYCITDALLNAVRGNLDDGLIFCGENAWRSHKMERVEDIMKEFSQVKTTI